MRLALSSIAWERADDIAVSQLLQRLQIDAIDIAPSQYFPNPQHVCEARVAQVRRWWRSRGIEITGMQSLCFGTTGLNLFAGAHSQAALLLHLTAVCRIAAGLGATRLVFGSPKNRDCNGLGAQQSLDIATAFFRQLGDIAHDHGVTICLEPVPARYGANFMLTSAETAEVVRRVAHGAIRMQLDTGALTINGEDVARVLHECSELIGHVHASEPGLVPLGDGTTDHPRVLAALRGYLPQHVVSVEMLTGRGEASLPAIERALRAATRYYRHPAS
ncbi:xylose isomerase [Pseudomonas sp. M47T1]|uniref:sugar phosphate isomerase/epimerase family protein n=1 Tax=unclassified Pseudomonas TaxID=196821 RepID=UPI0002606B29|nr:sugar phosphate isomerase/epimerase family protein [Pseudomonas sp. M47T1]EIK97919.1 xylose isomerase [Pseudomonas sp. M47T1]